jgi:predicted nucleic acid-binding protein
VTVVDTSVLFALVSHADRRHDEVVAWYSRHPVGLVTTPLAVAELDHILRRWATDRALDAVYAQMETGALRVEWWDDALSAALKVVRRHRDIGLVDSSLVALAAHLGSATIATLDERHFRSLQPLTGESGFTLLPADAD